MTEASHEQAIRDLLTRIGFTVYKLSQGYRKGRGGTRQTEGLPDLYAFHRARKLTLWIEVKPPEEAARLAKLLARRTVPPSAVKDYRRALAQAAFGELCRATGQPYAYGTLPEALAELHRLGFKIGA